MKRFSIYFLVCLATLLGSCDTEKNTENPDRNYFVKYYGGDGDQYGVDMHALADGSFILVGNFVVSSEESQLYLLRVTADGDIIWEKRHGDSKHQWLGRDLEPTDDGNFVVVSDFVDFNIRQEDRRSEIKVIKISPDGAIFAEQTYQGTGSLFSHSITALRDGSFVITGATDATNSDSDPSDAMNIRIDQNLVRVPDADWVNSTFGYANVDVGVRIFQPTDTTYYVFGYTNSTLSGDQNPLQRMGLFYVLRDRKGATGPVWYPGNVVTANDTRVNSVEEVPSVYGGGYLVVGTSQTSLGISEIFLARLRPTLTFKAPVQGDALFYDVVRLGRNIRGVSGTMSQSGEVGFLLLGDEVRTTGATNLWVSKVNQTGNVLWSRSIGAEAYNDMGAKVLELPDGRVAVLATMGLANSQFKMALIKLNRDGNFLK